MENTIHYLPPWQLKGEGFIIPFLANKKEIIENGFLSEDDKKTYKGGLGACMIVNYESSNVGPYFELLFIPGDFEHTDSSNKIKLYKRITKIYVSSELSIQEGRLNWAIPKEYADFTWETKQKTTFINVLSKDKKNILSTSLKRKFFPFPVTTKIYPVTLLQKSDSSQMIQTQFSGYGKGYISNINNWTLDENFFIDIKRNARFYFGLAVNEFNITFPIPEMIS